MRLYLWRSVGNYSIFVEWLFKSIQKLNVSQLSHFLSGYNNYENVPLPKLLFNVIFFSLSFLFFCMRPKFIHNFNFFSFNDFISCHFCTCTNQQINAKYVNVMMKNSSRTTFACTLFFFPKIFDNGKHLKKCCAYVYFVELLSYLHNEILFSTYCP